MSSISSIDHLIITPSKNIVYGNNAQDEERSQNDDQEGVLLAEYAKLNSPCDPCMVAIVNLDLGKIHYSSFKS
jgi:hypothetical protein